MRFEDVSKRYWRHGARHRSLRSLVFGSGTPGRREQFWALRDVSFGVEAGSATALIGGNGAGKSTLLRLAAGLSVPTEGAVAVPPRTVSVLGLGASFDGTLTGAENAFTALVVNGLRRRAAAAELAHVQEFAELEDFFESPVRTYSAGMGLRLAFAVATRLPSEAMLVDEVLSVGDLRFQAKCVEHLRGLRADGSTILMASHDLDQVASLCPHAVWLQAGRVRQTGPSREVIDAYRDAMRSRTLELTPPPDAPGERDGLELRRNRFGSQELRLEDVRLNGAGAAEIEPGGALAVDARLIAGRQPAAVVLGMTIWRVSDQLEVVKSHAELGTVRADQRVHVAIDRLDLAPGRYVVDVGAYHADWSAAYDYHWGVHGLRVAGAPSADGGVLETPVRWSATDATASAGPSTG
jgi:lipopolysaccharide transport system ATP-binding protein